ncbi:MAG: OmpA family protein [Gammaproteobacteria bacterium]
MRILLATAIAAVSVSAATGAQAHEANQGYWGNNVDGQIWRNSYGECWQTGTITKEQAAAGCDGAAKPAAKVAAPAPVAAAPADSGKSAADEAAAAAAAAAKAAEEAAAAAAAAKDTDGDGVPDRKDDCPDTKAGAKVDKHGCYIVLKENVTVSINVKFPSGSTRLHAEDEAEIKKLADFMTEYPQTTVEVGGHTDNVGAASTNRKLSQARADAVRKVLIDKFGIDGSRITAKGYGPDKPVADNGTVEGRNANRRVEGVVSQTVEKVQQ